MLHVLMWGINISTLLQIQFQILLLKAFFEFNRIHHLIVRFFPMSVTGTFVNSFENEVNIDKYNILII